MYSIKLYDFSFLTYFQALIRLLFFFLKEMTSFVYN